MPINNYIFSPQKQFITSFNHYLSHAFSYYFTINHLAHIYFIISHIKKNSIPITLISPDNATAYMGVRWWITLIDTGKPLFSQPIDDILDCCDNAGLAMAALRLGQKKLFFMPGSKQFNSLQARASTVQATILDQKPASFDLTSLKFTET